jgi:hypothetical protein
MPIIWTDRFDQEAFEEEVLALPIAHRLFIGPLETWMLALLATGVLVLVILLTAARRWLKPAGRCIKCNEIACVRCRPEFIGTGQCNQCVYYKIRSSYVDPKESWLREKRIENAISFRSKFQAFITFFVPGSGQILRGRTIRGVVFLFGLSTALGGVFLFTPIMSLGAAPQTHLATGSVISTAIWSLIAFVFYFLALIDIYSRR